MNTYTPIHWGARPDEHKLASAALVTVSLVFITAYGLANRLTQTRADVGTAVFDWERMIPFVGWTIVPYLSIVVFFAGSFFLCRDREQLRAHVQRLLAVLAISLACFALWPLRFTFERPPTEGVIGALFDLLQMFDLPYNRAPSLHISVLVLLWVRLMPRVQIGRAHV